MGHRHSPAQERGQRGFFGAERGAAPPNADRRSLTRPAGAALFALRVYQAYLSHLFAGSCRFQPTCSQYAYEAVERFGVARGAWLALRRLLRCHPFSRSFGLDPVPECHHGARALRFVPLEFARGRQDKGARS